MSTDHDAGNSGMQSSLDTGQSSDSAPSTGAQPGDEEVDLNQFPWWFTLVNMSELARRLDMPALDSEGGIELLAGLSEVMEHREKGNLADDVKLFIQRVGDMPPEARYCCCDEQGDFVTFRNGKALVMDAERFVRTEFTEMEPIHPDDPVGWIWNALQFIQPDDLPLFDGIDAEFPECPEFTVEPFTIELFPGKLKTVSAPITPRVYRGGHPVKVALHAARAVRCLSYMAAAYEAIGDELQEIWTKRYPQASEPNPVWSLLLKRDVDSFSEAILFFGQASKELRRSSEVDRPAQSLGEPVLDSLDHDFGGGETKESGEQHSSPVDSEPNGQVKCFGDSEHDVCGTDDAGKRRGQWAHSKSAPAGEYKHGPLEGFLKDIAQWTATDLRVLKTQNANGLVWIQTVHSKRYKIWFRDNDTYSTAWHKRNMQPRSDT